jgi:hypothetical protein
MSSRANRTPNNTNDATNMPTCEYLLPFHFSHQAVAHVLQLLRDFPRRALQLVRDLLLFGRVQDVEALATKTTALEGKTRGGQGWEVYRSPSITSLTGT